MRQLRFRFSACLFAIIAAAATASAQPAFVNGLVIPGERSTPRGSPAPTPAASANSPTSTSIRSATNGGRSRIADPAAACSTTPTRVQRIDIQVHPITGRISNFRVKETVSSRDRQRRSDSADRGRRATVRAERAQPAAAERRRRAARPQLRSRGARRRSAHRSLPHRRRVRAVGLRVQPQRPADRRCSRRPRSWCREPTGTLDYVGGRDGGASGVGPPGQPRLRGARDQPRRHAALRRAAGSAARRGPAARTDATDNDGRDGRNVRIVVFDNDWRSRTYRQSVAQYVYPLEPQARHPRAHPRAGRHRDGQRSAAGPQHRPLGHRRASTRTSSSCSSATIAASASTTRPGAGPAARPSRRSASSAASASTRSTSTARPTSPVWSLPDDGDLAAAGIVPVQKNDARCSSTWRPTTLLPNGNQAEKWEGLAIGPRLARRRPRHRRRQRQRLLGDADRQRRAVRRLRRTSPAASRAACWTIRRRCEVNPPASDLVIDKPVALPDGLSLLPGVLHAYRASAEGSRRATSPRTGRRWAARRGSPDGRRPPAPLFRRLGRGGLLGALARRGGRLVRTRDGARFAGTRERGGAPLPRRRPGIVGRGHHDAVGDEPANAVGIEVDDGVVDVLLGDRAGPVLLLMDTIALARKC